MNLDSTREFTPESVAYGQPQESIQKTVMRAVRLKKERTAATFITTNKTGTVYIHVKESLCRK